MSHFRSSSIIDSSSALLSHPNLIPLKDKVQDSNMANSDGDKIVQVASHLHRLDLNEQRQILRKKETFSHMLNIVAGIPSNAAGRFKTVWSARILRDAVIKACELDYFRQDVTISCLDKMNSIKLPQVSLLIVSARLLITVRLSCLDMGSHARRLRDLS